MVSICPLLWQRDVKLQQTNKQNKIDTNVKSEHAQQLDTYIIQMCTVEVVYFAGY